MISVCASESDHPVVREFFELFKTPWQFHTSGAPAKILLCDNCEPPANDAALVMIFSSSGAGCPPARFTTPGAVSETALFEFEQIRFPVYCGKLLDAASKNILFERSPENGAILIRAGYGLFAEIRQLLTAGQPEEFAATPTLERHIEFLRKLILDAGQPLVEIPPKPAGHEFVACLTHDVDHVGIRNHKFDHTMFGFLSRATVGSVLDVARGKKTAGQLAVNWLAAARLPLVHAGLAKDFWYQFDGYAKLENGAPSTFFVIPKKGEAGLDPNGECRPNRAASYDARDLKEILRGLENIGKEVAVHGLNAWRDANAGREEKEIISEIAGVAGGTGVAPVQSGVAPDCGREGSGRKGFGRDARNDRRDACSTDMGVRMHWLYFNAQSPVELEKAGYAYDSTCGYNGTVGYRAGTAQVFKPLTAKKMLELPMEIMDTALFYPSYLNLSDQQAREKIRPLIADAVLRGGALTVNWHDRSIAPERLWDGTYRWLLDELKEHNAWFATASQAVAWFQNRRDVRFEISGGQLQVRSVTDGKNLPAMRVRSFGPESGGKFTEKTLHAGEEISLAA
jgi:hypothetical protein